MSLNSTASSSINPPGKSATSGLSDKVCRRTGKRTLRRELSFYIIGLTLVSAFFYTMLLKFYYERGFAETTHITLRVELQEFAKQYALDPSTPLPHSQVLHMRIDDWHTMPTFFQQQISKEEIDTGEVIDVDWSPNGHHEWEGVRFLVGQSVLLNDGKRLYGIIDHKADLLTDIEKDEFDRLFRKIFIVGGVFISLMVCTVWLFNRRMQRNTRALSAWAESLSMENLKQDIPDFRYQELNRISDQLYAAFDRISGLLAREHRFLRNASHELRTPIAVIRANMELLEKIGYSGMIERPLERIQRANKGMQQLTETLLWISRENEVVPKVETVHPEPLVQEIIEDLSYLLSDKPVELQLNFTEALQEVELPVTPLRIVLNNLIRNAFQHTQEGLVRFTLTPDSLEIENQDNGLSHGDSEDSFGLGLMLVEQICERMDWVLEIKRRADGVTAKLTIPVA